MILVAKGVILAALARAQVSGFAIIENGELLSNEEAEARRCREVSGAAPRTFIADDFEPDRRFWPEPTLGPAEPKRASAQWKQELRGRGGRRR